jgi:hypothetical protein
MGKVSGEEETDRWDREGRWKGRVGWDIAPR